MIEHKILLKLLGIFEEKPGFCDNIIFHPIINATDDPPQPPLIRGEFVANI
jgi:hypothetical protein